MVYVNSKVFNIRMFNISDIMNELTMRGNEASLLSTGRSEMKVLHEVKDDKEYYANLRRISGNLSNTASILRMYEGKLSETQQEKMQEVESVIINQKDSNYYKRMHEARKVLYDIYLFGDKMQNSMDNGFFGGNVINLKKYYTDINAYDYKSSDTCNFRPKGEVTNNPNGFYIALNASWYIRLLTDENFVSKLKTRWFEIRTDMLSSINNLDTLGNNLSEAAVCNFTKWFLYGSEDLTSETLKTEYLDTVDNLKTWMLTRYNFMDSAISAL